VDERALTERLITYDTSQPDGIRACAGFIKGWLEAREIDVHDSVRRIKTSTVPCRSPSDDCAIPSSRGCLTW